ncbi:MAG: FGGY family carbohydrate kinase [Spirochaetia bacterium]|jgi:xylulokinase
MKKDLLIGIDLGSSNVKTLLIDDQGRTLGLQTEEYPTLFPQPGWIEYDPNDWWNAVKNTLKRVIADAKVDAKRVAGVGVSGLGCCAVPMDEKGALLYNALPWSDLRAQKEADFLMKNCGEEIKRACGLTPTALNTIPHLIWLKNERPDIYRKLYKFTESSGFIIQRLTGEFILDLASASFVEYGINLKTLDYDKGLIKAMQLDFEKFPRLLPNCKAAGGITRQASAETGLEEGTPVACGGNDLPAGAVGSGALHPGQAFYYSGTGSNATVLTDKLFTTSPDMLHCLCTHDPRVKMIDGVQGSVGYSLRWFRDTLGGAEHAAAQTLGNGVSSFDMMDLEAGRTSPGSGGLLFLPFLFGHFNPVLNPLATGVFFGISPTTTRATMIRAIIEGCVFNAYESYRHIEDMGIDYKEIIFVGGPSSSPVWCQALADTTNRKVITVSSSEPSTFGDAITAGVAAGVFSGFEDIVGRTVKQKKQYMPDDRRHTMYSALYGVYLGAYQDAGRSFNALAEARVQHGI